MTQRHDHLFTQDDMLFGGELLSGEEQYAVREQVKSLLLQAHDEEVAARAPRIHQATRDAHLAEATRLRAGADMVIEQHVLTTEQRGLEEPDKHDRMVQVRGALRKEALAERAEERKRQLDRRIGQAATVSPIEPKPYDDADARTRAAGDYGDDY